MKKNRIHKRRRILIPVAILMIASVAYVLGWSSVFTVKQVVVTGAPNPSEAFAIEHSFHTGEKLARLESQAVAKSLKKYNWLDHSQISRNWINGVVTVRVWTRTPIAQFESHLVDGSGVVFDLPSVDPANLPAITGMNAASAKFGADLLMGLPVQLRTEVMSLAVHGSDSVVLSVKDPTLNRVLSVVWGDLSNMTLKARVYEALLSLPENSKITKVDVSAPHAPIVQ